MALPPATLCNTAEPASGPGSIRSPSRRQIIKAMAAMGGMAALPPAIARAVALPADVRTGSIRDVEHVVILMQENRSFDHYFGTLRGVRGFGDPRPLRLRSGGDVFRQPNPAGGSVLPFHLDSRATAAPVMASLDHSWKGSHAEWAAHDVWVKHKTSLTMGHFRREDIPFYYALADAFTIGDQYFCSVHGPTNPNRLFLFSGTSGLAVGASGKQCVDNVDDGNWTGDRARDKADFRGWGWTTYAERLSGAGVTWNVYQEYDNYGDNPLACFARFRGADADPALVACARNIVPGSTAANAAHTEAQHLVDAFARDAAADRLPQVSWIVAPYAYSEHPEASPQHGEALVARLIDALTANPAVWAKTALIINYDENDGFFDHVPAPIPATDARWGKSTVDTRGEAWGSEPMGLGVRVPLLVVSPWTRGGWVCSEVFDHTSVIRFLERRFGVQEPNITPWRRAVTGDLTAMFDFVDPDRSALATLPSTAGYLDAVAAAAKRPKPGVPATQRMPQQEPGQRPARPLPYGLSVDETAPVDGMSLSLAFVNQGSTGAVFGVYPGGLGEPRYYTVEPGKRLADRLPANGRYDVTVHGPNGFVRQFAGNAAATGAPLLRVTPSPDRDHLEVRLLNPGDAPLTVTLRPIAYGGSVRPLVIAARGEHIERVPIAASDHWYDMVIETGDGAFLRRFAGHVETGRASRSDPAIGCNPRETVATAEKDRERIAS